MPTKTNVPKAVEKAPKKVTAKKVAVKKVAAKKAAAKTSARAVKKTAPAMTAAGLVCATDEHCFWTTNGTILKSLEDLVFAFGSMDETVFVYHADGQKNDFAEWVEHVLKDAECANDLRKTTSVKKAHAVAKKHLKKYR